ncbi:DegT/DnrJ/EryC1/StrS family aminotransferase [Arachidicoccus soli]|uniref:Aminotransferase class V-fold PLP-dependent enzyme n=1 Tax=Arachidicoccus soli TaxID=2341117 RepID=A0A386HQQ6_9BACT|nr:aminotransferase class V-fold PLP-dependent enzyme [Arachidicoccus soli]AYD47989.1 aminotransferase class V-fold PLP-dependent enzyme [Arachidicoccus soli]
MIPLYKPYMPEELPELSNILHSGSLAYGKYGKQFEIDLKKVTQCSEISSVNSFSAAMLVALKTIDIKPGDEIIASPMSCLASNQPAASLGATLIWADIDPHRGTLDPESVKTKITNKTKAIIHNHHCGYVGYIDEINAIANEHGIMVIDDAIEAFGSKYKGQFLGNVGTDITVFSFQTVRLPNTVDGGAIACKDFILQQKANLIRDLGVDRKIFRNPNGEISKDSDISIPGYGFTMNEMNSYIGSLQLENIVSLLKRQELNAEKWKIELRNKFDDIQILLENDLNQNPNYWIFGMRSKRKIEYINKFRELGYYASGVHLPNYYYSVFNNNNLLPGVEDFYERFFALPCGWWLNDNEIGLKF